MEKSLRPALSGSQSASFAPFSCETAPPILTSAALKSRTLDLRMVFPAQCWAQQCPETASPLIMDFWGFSSGLVCAVPEQQHPLS